MRLNVIVLMLLVVDVQIGMVIIYFTNINSQHHEPPLIQDVIAPHVLISAFTKSAASSPEIKWHNFELTIFIETINTG